MKFSVLVNVLWATSFCCHTAILLLLILRKSFRSLPAFFTYIAFQFPFYAAAFLTAKYGTKHIYFWVYYIGGYTNYALQIGVIVEIANRLLKPVRWWIRENSRWLLWLAAFSSVAATAVALSLAPTGSQGFDLWENRISVLLTMLMCGALAGVAGIAGTFHLLRSNSHIVAVGNGSFLILYSILLEDFTDAAFHHHNKTAELLASIFYVVILIYWLIKFWRREPAPLQPTKEMMEQVVALHRQVKYDLDKLDGPRP